MKKICKTLMLLIFIIIATSIWVSASEIPSVLKTDVTLCASEDDGITGTGTKSDPYIIDSASDFITFTGGMNSGNTYTLLTSIARRNVTEQGGWLT